MKRCTICNSNHTQPGQLCSNCSDETVLLTQEEQHPPLSTTDETVLLEEHETSSSYSNVTPEPLSPIQNQILYERYKIIKVIGKGGMGTVYLAQDLRLDGKELAIKEVTLNTTESKEFIDEAKMLVQLEHINLPKITDYYPPNEAGQTYLVMDYVRGQTLQQLFNEQNKQFPTDKIMKYAIQLCNLFDYLHSHDPAIIYRDLKPSNIMIDEKDNVQLIDFGIARKYQEGKHADTTLLGTENFAAPEQFVSTQQTDHRTDLYSFGATLYYLLTGGKHYHLVKKQVHELNNRLATELCQIVMKLLEYEPHKRFQSAKELKEQLINLRVNEKTKELPPTQPANASKPKTKQPTEKEKENKKAKPAKTSFAKKVKRFIYFVVSMAILAGAAFGTYKYYEQQNSELVVIERIEQAIKDSDIATLTELFVSDDPTFEITEQQLQHFRLHFAQQPKELKVFIESLKAQVTYKEMDDTYRGFEIIEGEKLHYVIPTYKVLVTPVYLAIQANQTDAIITINDINIGSTDSAIYEQSFGPFMPGFFQVTAELATDFASLEQTEDVTVLYGTNDDTLTFDLTGETISISANYQNAEIFINNQSIQTTISETASFGPVTTDGSMKVFVQQTFPWGIAKSNEQTITNTSQLNFEIEPLTDELQTTLFTIGNDYVQSVLQTYISKDLKKLQHVTPNVQNIYNNLLSQIAATEANKIGKLTAVHYDLDTLDFYETTNEQYEVVVNVSFEYEATVQVNNATPTAQVLKEHQKLTYTYDAKANQWLIQDVILTNASPLVNVQSYSF